MLVFIGLCYLQNSDFFKDNLEVDKILLLKVNIDKKHIVEKWINMFSEYCVKMLKIRTARVDFYGYS